MRKDTTAFRDANRYCEYHQDTEHTIAECLNLAKVLGKMKLATEAPPPPQVRKATVVPTGHRAPKQEPTDEEVGDILHISRGEASRGANLWEGHRYPSDVDRTIAEKRPWLSTRATFMEEDMKDVTTPPRRPICNNPHLP